MTNIIGSFGGNPVVPIPAESKNNTGISIKLFP
jgi:hypothetical protein